MDDAAQAEWIAARNNAFASDDLSWAAKMLPDASSPRVVEMAFHKARHQCLAASDAKRIQSRDWLVDNGCTDLLGAPVSKTDNLPQ